METLRVISLGAGVQSSAMLAMSCNGDLPKADYAIFADTQWEPQSVYNYLDLLRPLAERAGIKLLSCTRGDIRGAFLNKAEIRATPPLFVKKPDAERSSLLRRQCTMDYKIVPIRRLVRTLQSSRSQPVEMWLGITMDEYMRAKSSQVKWVKNTFPLLEKKLSRQDCLAYLRANGLPQPPKSACIGCPFRSDAHWKQMKEEDKVSWDDAVQMDKDLRSGVWDGTLSATPYLHRSAVPLGEIEFKPKERDKVDMWNNECEGMCGM